MKLLDTTFKSAQIPLFSDPGLVRSNCIQVIFFTYFEKFNSSADTFLSTYNNIIQCVVYDAFGRLFDSLTGAVFSCYGDPGGDERQRIFIMGQDSTY